MKRFACWNEERVRKVMDADALHVESHIFLATHHPIKMYRRTALQSAGSAYSEKKLLQDFLSTEDYMFVAVLGQSGTGKSHLIRWVSANIESNEQRKVVLVPRLTSLKKIIELILDGMDAIRFDVYRQKLKMASEYMGPAEARELLTSQIAIAIGPSGSHLRQNLTEEEEFLVDTLHHLFHDPHFRKIFLQDGGIIHRLTDHVFGQGSLERRESRVEFNADDIPLNIADFDKASEEAREVYTTMMLEPSLRDAAVNWINKNLDSAIAKMLNFQGNDLIDLMNDVREELGKQGTELVLLIEDFAVLQGIDHQLLDALLVKPRQEGRTLCSLRVALACTTGYFDTLPDTVKTRVNFTVSLDVKTGTDIPLREVMRFAARYLNAVRRKEDDIKTWHRERLNNGEAELRSACDDCQFREQCHQGFSSADGIGLYPFNPEALEVMYNRLSKVDGGFNPRLLIQQVLRHTLTNYTSYLLEGRFPAPGMLEHFGGRAKNRLSALEINKLKSRDPVNYARREVLLELWTKAYEITNIDPAIHEAFELPELQGQGTYQPGPPDPPPAPRPPEPPVMDKRLQALNKSVQEIDAWRNGEVMSQALAQTLRSAIFNSINSFIDWDVEQLSLTWLRSNNIWVANRVSFLNQSTTSRVASKAVTLSLPLELDNQDDVAIALQGILYYNYYKNWNFERGTEYFRYFALYLERWSSHILEQLRQRNRVDDSNTVFDACLFLLAVRALMRGTNLFRISDTDKIVALADEQPLSFQREGPWGRILNGLDTGLSGIKTVIMHGASASKGGSSSIKLVDTALILSSLKNILKRDDMFPALGSELMEYREISRMLTNVRDLQTTVDAERKHYLQMYRSFLAEIGEGMDKQVFTQEIRSAAEAVYDDGGITSLQYDSLKAKLSAFQQASVVTALTELNALEVNWESKTTVLRQVESLGRLPVQDIRTIGDFIASVSQFFIDATEKLGQDISKLTLTETSASVDTVRQEIHELLTELQDVVNGEGELGK